MLFAADCTFEGNETANWTHGFWYMRWKLWKKSRKKKASGLHTAAWTTVGMRGENRT